MSAEITRSVFKPFFFIGPSPIFDVAGGSSCLTWSNVPYSPSSIWIWTKLRQRMISGRRPRLLKDLNHDDAKNFFAQYLTSSVLNMPSTVRTILLSPGSRKTKNNFVRCCALLGHWTAMRNCGNHILSAMIHCIGLQDFFPRAWGQPVLWANLLSFTPRQTQIR